MADRGGFEPPNEFLRCTLSKRVPSTAQPPVQGFFSQRGGTIMALVPGSRKVVAGRRLPVVGLVDVLNAVPAGERQRCVSE